MRVDGFVRVVLVRAIILTTLVFWVLGMGARFVK